MYPPLVNHWIDDGEVVSPTGGWFEKRCPIDDRVMARVTRGTADDVRRAVDAAACAADSWGRLPAPKRGEVLGRAAAALRSESHAFAEIIRLETGKPWKFAAAEVASIDFCVDAVAVGWSWNNSGASSRKLRRQVWNS